MPDNTRDKCLLTASDVPEDVLARWCADGTRAEHTLSSLFENVLQSHGDARLVVASAARPADMTLQNFGEQVRRLAGGLRARGIRPGDIVAVQLPNWVEAGIAHAAIAWLGAVILPIVHIYGPAELGHILLESRPKMLITAGEWRGVDYALRAMNAPVEAGLVARCAVGRTNAADVIGWDELLAAPPVARENTTRPEALALILYTSGTTSEAKSVFHSNASLASELAASLTYEADDRFALCPWPPGHIAGVFGLLRFWGAGLPTILMDQWDGAEAVRLVDAYDIGRTSGTPMHLASLLDAADRAGESLPTLTDYLAGATVIPSALISRCAERGLKTYRSYGLSEHPTISRGRPDDPLEKRLFTDGRLCPGVEIRIIGETGEDLPTGQEGEIVSRGPDMFIGYGRPETDARLPGGWLRTGDIGRVDVDGYLSVTDRKKDIIIRGGENISSREVEEALVTVPGVIEAAVVGIPDVILGERVCAIVRLSPAATVSLLDVRLTFESLGLARQKTPERLIEMEDFPRTANGKVRKSELKRLFASERTFVRRPGYVGNSDANGNDQAPEG